MQASIAFFCSLKEEKSRAFLFLPLSKERQEEGKEKSI